MNKKSTLHDNFEINFTLKGITSIVIGIYFLGLAFILKYILDSFLIDDHTIGMLSPEILEVVVISCIASFILLSCLALFFAARRNAKTFQFLLWNRKTKIAVFQFILGLITVTIAGFLLLENGYEDYLTSTFLVFYALLLVLFKNKQRKNILVLSGISILLAIVCFNIPSYWNPAINILGIAHICYGIIQK
ncbi:hypothetical protein [Polaribacter tangerinus]|uniref:hypothetical protein n=1 Tax=Polaribacter tangerinus TaxID=1920034 RepID=UPI000B4B0A71|nr:hypothetical protein [Polaribacter tangerinus]